MAELSDDRIAAACRAREIALTFTQLAEILESGDNVAGPIIIQLPAVVTQLCVQMALLSASEKRST